MKIIKTIIGLLMVLVLLIITTPINGLADTYGNRSTDDAIVNSTAPDNNYGSVDHLSVYFDGTVYNQSYLKFDLSSIPDSASISSARLWLWCINPDVGSTPHVNLHYVANDGWSETTLTWNNRPAYDSVALETTLQTPSNWQYINLLNGNHWDYTTDLLDDYLSLILTEGEPLTSDLKQAWWYSNNYSNDYFRPLLIITYATPEPTTMLLLGLGLIGLAGVSRKFKK